MEVDDEVVGDELEWLGEERGASHSVGLTCRRISCWVSIHSRSLFSVMVSLCSNSDTVWKNKQTQRRWAGMKEQHITPVVCLVILKSKCRYLWVYAHVDVLGLVVSNSTSAYLVWLLGNQWHTRYKMHKASMKFWTITVTLTLKTTLQFYTKH